jgi:acetylornithine deacetylase
MGFNADGAIISEPSFLRICPAQRGGRTVHLTFSALNEGILSGSAPGVIEQLRCFLNSVPDFARRRSECAKRHPMYDHLADPVPVTVTRVFTAPWGTSEPTNTPSLCRVELFWQAMPGETVEEIDSEFFA